MACVKVAVRNLLYNTVTRDWIQVMEILYVYDYVVAKLRCVYV